jgi:hypothetical protein
MMTLKTEHTNLYPPATPGDTPKPAVRLGNKAAMLPGADAPARLPGRAEFST